VKKYVVKFRLWLSGFLHLIVLQFILVFRRYMLPPSSELNCFQVDAELIMVKMCSIAGSLQGMRPVRV